MSTKIVTRVLSGEVSSVPGRCCQDVCLSVAAVLAREGDRAHLNL